jgi:tRNA A37 threonylcarbamoyladenosine dehydratase
MFGILPKFYGTMERFSRIEKMIGSKRLARLQASTVTIAGLGAVGGYVVEGLARAGVGGLRLIDFDIVSPANINRQIYALDSTLGRLKTEVATERVLDINPDCRVEALNIFLDQQTMEQVFTPGSDLLIDAIDALNPKVEMLVRGWEKNIPLISSMGAALRTDPLQIRTADIMDSRQCPLARRIRKRLRRRGVGQGITCVFSLEKVEFDFKEPGNEKMHDQDHGLIRGRKRHVLGSLPTIPAIFGLTIANLALEKLYTL